MATPMTSMAAMKVMKTMKAMKSMKAMNAMSAMKTKHGALSAIGAYSTVAEMVGMQLPAADHVQPKQVQEIAEAMMALAAKQLSATGSFKLAGALNMKLTKKPARPATEGVRPITKEPCVFKARKASLKLNVTATKKLLLLNMYSDWVFSKCYVPIM